MRRAGADGDKGHQRLVGPPDEFLDLLRLLGFHNQNRLMTGGKAHVAAMLFEYGGLVDYVLGSDNALKLPLVVDLPFITRSDGIGHCSSPPAITDVAGVLN
jgi:hypothetical protein